MGLVGDLVDVLVLVHEVYFFFIIGSYGFVMIGLDYFYDRDAVDGGDEEFLSRSYVRLLG